MRGRKMKPEFLDPKFSFLIFSLLLAVATQSPAAPAAPHWSFQPIQRPGVPTPPRRSSLSSTNPIDAFLFAKLPANPAALAPEADARTLIRRLYFTLLGLPPTPAEVEAFAADYSPNSSLEIRHSKFQTLLDRLFASPHFGERWARHWMDVVRYADTHGTEHDAWLPHAWRYRDYLIRAFNADLPFDQFVREHIAGDLLPKPRWNNSLALNESLLATAWWRLVEFNQTPVDVKGEEVIVVDSQIDALSKAFLGLTVSCARCHDHKFDPISQRDFHGLYSILASTRTTMRVLDAPEKLHAADAELTALKTEIRTSLAETWKQQIEHWPAAILVAADVRRRMGETNSLGNPPPHVGGYEPEITRWRSAFAIAETNKSPLAPLLKTLRTGAPSIARHEPNAAPLPSDARRSNTYADFSTASDNAWFTTGGFTRHTPAGDFSLTTTGSPILSAIYPAGRYSHLISDKHPGTLRSPNFTITNRFISALVTGDNNARLRLVIENFQGDSLLFSQVTPKLTDRTNVRWVTLTIRDTWRDRRAYLELTPRDDFPYLGIVRDVTKLPTDGRSAAGIIRVIFHNGETLPEPPALPDELTLAIQSAASLTPLPTDNTNAPPAPTRPNLGTALTAATRRAITAFDQARCDDTQAHFLNHLLRLGLLANQLPPASALATNPSTTKLTTLLTRYRELEARIPVPQRVVAVTDEAPGFDEPLYPRGNPHQPGEIIPRQFLRVLKPNPTYHTPGSGRRELAEDLLASPLLTRVIVNRLWQHAFGTGLVPTTDNFGRLGETPSHPELLDWLATELPARGWSLKAMLRLMVSSAAFREEKVISNKLLVISRNPEATGNQLPSQSPTVPASTDVTNPPPPTNYLSLITNYFPPSPRRLDAESLRDSILAASGQLDRTLYGPSIPIPVPPGQRDDYSPVNGPLDGRGRRSLYLEVRRNHPVPFLLAFDQPKPVSPAGRREPTNVPAQSLTLLNDPFVLEQAGHFARRALAQPGDIHARLRWLYATALSRPATDAELTRAQQFLTHQATLNAGDEKLAWQDFAHALFNLKEFLYLR